MISMWQVRYINVSFYRHIRIYTCIKSYRPVARSGAARGSTVLLGTERSGGAVGGGW